MLDEWTFVRYELYYADDVVVHGIKTKSEFMHRQLADKIDLSFEKDLREKEGIFFNIDVRPTSPRKDNNNDGVLRPFSPDPNKQKSDFSISVTSGNKMNISQNV